MSVMFDVYTLLLFFYSFTIYHIYVVSIDIHMFVLVLVLVLLFFLFCDFISATFISKVHSLAWDVRHTTQFKHHICFTKHNCMEFTIKLKKSSIQCTKIMLDQKYPVYRDAKPTYPIHR